MTGPDRVETPRLLGRRPTFEDVDGLLAIYGDEAVAAWLWPGLRGGVRSRAQVRGLIELDLAHWRAHRFGPWVFFDADGGPPVGRCGLRHTVAAGAAEVEVLWSVASARWREGLATEMAEASARVAFGELGLEEVVAFAVVDNVASQGVMRSAGFAFEREFGREGFPCVLHRRRRPAVQAPLARRPWRR